MRKIWKYLNEPSVTSFGDQVYRPRWVSVLCDYACILTLGIYKPRRRLGEVCFGDNRQARLSKKT